MIDYSGVFTEDEDDKEITGSTKTNGEVQHTINIVQIIGSLDDTVSGPAYSVPSLCRALVQNGHAVSLISGTAKDCSSQSRMDGYEDVRCPMEFNSIPGLSKLGFSQTLRNQIMVATDRAEVLHTHGLWRFANVYPAVAARRFQKPLVLSPRGMLAPSALAYSAFSKRIFWTLQQHRAAQSVSAFHATSEQEYLDIRAYGLSQPVAIVPNGIDSPDTYVFDQLQKTGENDRIVLFLGRLHPVKAVDRLIQAWHLLGEKHIGWKLIIVGPPEQGYDQVLIELTKKLRLTNVELRGSVRGAHKWSLFQNAQLSVLPSFSENFGVSVAESLVAGTPVIASHGTPWEELEARDCGWWIRNEPRDLADALSSALSLSDSARAAMGKRGQEWMRSGFSWSSIAGEMAEVYAWLSNRGPMPDCVRMR